MAKKNSAWRKLIYSQITIEQGHEKQKEKLKHLSPPTPHFSKVKLHPIMSNSSTSFPPKVTRGLGNP